MKYRKRNDDGHIHGGVPIHTLFIAKIVDSDGATGDDVRHIPSHIIFTPIRIEIYV